MADLIAQGENPQERWRRPLPCGEPVVLGRAADAWTVAWDPHVSRRHVRMEWSGGHLDVTRLPEARNPVFFRGKETSHFRLRPGEHFVIGRTTFLLTDQRVDLSVDSPQPVQQQAFTPQSLRQIRFRNPDHRIEVLSRLPEVISGAKDPAELCVALVSMLMAGVPRAENVALVAAADAEAEDGQRSPVDVLHWDQRLPGAGDFQPSQRLILQAIRQRQSVLHVWQETESPDAQLFTARRNVDWAICTPIPGRVLPGWGIYLAGRFHALSPSSPGGSEPDDPREDVKFTELVAAAVSSMSQMRALERQQASLSQFFSPVVMRTLAVEDPDVVLAPRETRVSVLFCDLRGFSLETERHADNLLELLHRVSKALGVMTHQILDQGGVVGDFQGDAAMGFWGWPLAQDDAVLRTCLAALAIRAEFEAAARDSDSALAGFHVGIGIATGKSVAGKIGTVDQVKVTVFGPSVNLASRLEGMTRMLGAPILLDEATARAVRRQMPPDVARLRRLARVRPYGMDASLEVSELLPPESGYPLLNDEHLRLYETAVDAFVAGRWAETDEILRRLPAEDPAREFLLAHMAQGDRRPPPGWNGVVVMSSK